MDASNSAIGTGDLRRLHAAIRSLRDEASAAERRLAPSIDALPEPMRASARNLAHALALRAADRAALQAELVRAGLSSLALLSGSVPDAPRAGFTADEGVALAERHAAALFGPPAPHATRVIATLPPWGAGDVAFMGALIDAGMDSGRINASHGDRVQWQASVDALRAAAAERGRHVPISMDLAGPKVRTGTCATGPIALRAGDALILHAGARDAAPASVDAPRDATGRATGPARVGVRPRELVEHLEPGHRVLFDDGNVRARCTSVDRSAGEATCSVEAVRAGAWPLKDRKGVNVPDTRLPIRALAETDLAALDFAIAHVDAVSMSFVRGPEDVADLHAAIRERAPLAAGRPIGVVAKIETPQGCEALPEILLELMKMPPCGVMLARGDLGVEIGFENLPEAQDEILALCESAHVPVIWATQVLESMVEHGFPTRGEVTDAADAARADAVMLGIGPFMVDAVRFIDALLARTRLRRARGRAILARRAPEFGGH